MNAYEESFVVAKPYRRWMKRVGCVLLVLLILAITLLILAACFLVPRHYLVKQRLEEAITELDSSDPGWRLADIEAAREQIPEEENSARVVVTAAKLLPRNWPTPEFHEQFNHLSPEEQLAPDELARLTQELERVGPALNEARKLVNMPRGRHRITYKRNVLNTLLEDQQRSRNVVQLLLHDALQCDQRQDMKGALTSCQAALNAARSLGDEPLAISQLVRTAGVFLACQGVERALAQGELRAEDLTGMQNLLADEETFPELSIVARGERALWHEMFDAMESGDVSISEMADGRSDGNERLFGFVYRDNIRAQHPTMLALMNRWIAIVQLPMSGQSEAEQQLNQEVRVLRGSAMLAALPLGGMPKLGDASRRKHALIRCTITALAAERYRLTHNKWPVSLDKLCPQFLNGVPSDPFDGEPLRYRRVEDGVIIYSISSDETDNDGNLDREHSNQPGVDIGIRLWDVAKRRQPPHPKPREEQKLP